MTTVDGAGYLHCTDEAVTTGVRYGCRLGIMDGGEEVFAGEAWGTAERPTFSVAGTRPNPARDGQLTLEFVLPTSEPAQLELFDVAERRIAPREVHEEKDCKGTPAAVELVPAGKPAHRQTSLAKRRANRRNVRRSTGPKTPAWKARSAANACKHGLLSRNRVHTPGADMR